MSNYWKSRKVCVLGGAGFIGSHLVEELLPIAKEVVIADNFSSGSRKNLPRDVEIHEVDLRNYWACLDVVQDCDTVFHLASDVGGRAYLMSHPQQMWGNLEIDSTIFRLCANSRIEKVIYFSSACVYPVDLGGYFRESDVREIEKADGVYGMAKLIGEKMMQDFPFIGVRIRPFTVYGARMKKGYAINDLIEKSFAHLDPFEVWGDGHQIVDWIYVKDLVRGVLLAAEKLENDAVSIGSSELNTPLSALDIIWKHINWRPKEINRQRNMPISPVRLADTSKIQGLGWTKNYSFEQGLKETIDYMVKR